ncbi:type II toxin-antitoxin system RelE/ParE family toxin [Botrimarina sp.]|uniref:type II toxin-antitoxin system RelE/ParE family toxin n=1 Tax=Botrimarina sp. TaxID=2795802 RepID=UPI0032EB8CF5
MRYKVVLTDAALSDAGKYLDFLIESAHTTGPAERWWRKAIAAVQSLESMPHRCPKPPENELREYTVRALIVAPCLFLYRVDDSRRTVEVFGFRHGRQMPSEHRLPE